MKNSNDTIGNRTRDLPACSAVPQPPAQPRAPSSEEYLLVIDEKDPVLLALYLTCLYVIFVCFCVWYSVYFLCGSLGVWRDTDWECLLRDRFINWLMRKNRFCTACYCRCWRVVSNILFIYIYIYSFIHSVVCLTTGPKPLPKRALHIVRSRASSFKWEYPLLSLTL